MQKSNLHQNPRLLSNMIKRYQAWGGPERPGNPGRPGRPGKRWEAQKVLLMPPMPIIMSIYCHCRRCSCMPVWV